MRNNFFSRGRRLGFILVIVLVCIVSLLISAVLFMNDDKKVTENEPYTGLTPQEILNHEDFGYLYPTVIQHEYILEDGTIGLFGKSDNIVVKANYYNDNIDDELIIKIAPKEYFGDVQLNTILYPDTIERKGSEYFADANNYIVHYHYSNSDIAKSSSSFFSMVHSSDFYSKSTPIE